ncbi:MAG: helix-turn-helix transcriptional regulator [Clostridiales bacterium]|jgi:AraC-like DNA-binding protein|nr:helix-turn-helix transcriptional regulator [Clostridiales bacterium]
MAKLSYYKSSYYYKILFWVFAVVIAPLLIVCFVFGGQLFSSLAQRAVQLEVLALSQSVIQIEEQLRSIQQAALQFSFQEDTMRAARLPSLQEDLALFNKLKNNSIGLRSSFNAGLAIRSVQISSVMYNWRYDTELGYMQGNDEGLPSEPIEYNKWGIEQEYVKNAYFELVPRQRVLAWHTRFLNYDEVAVRVDYQNFCEAFDTYRSFSDMYALESAGTVIYDSTGEQVGAEASTLPFYPCLAAGGDQFSCILEGKRYRGVYQSSQELDWVYVSIWKEDFLRGEFFGAFAIAAAISIAVLGLTLFSIRMLSLKLYRPIYNLRHRLEDASGEHPSEENSGQANELQAIENTMGRMIGDNQSLQRQVGNLRTLTRELMICQLFTGNLQTGLQDSLEDYGIVLQWKNKALVTISSPKLRWDAPGTASEMYFLGALQILRDILQDNALVAPMMIDNMIVLVIGDDGPDFDRVIENALKTAYDKITTSLQLEIGMAVSARFETTGEIADAFDRIRHVLKYRGGAVRGIYCLGRSGGQIQYPCKMSESVLEGIKSGDTDSVLEALGSFLDDVFLRMEDAYQQQLYIMWMIADILRLVPDYSAFIVNQSASAAHSDPVQALFSLSSLEEKKKWMHDNVIRPVNEMLHTNDANKAFIVKRMISFIRENSGSCGGDIEACASFLNYHSSYLRAVFKDIMGISYGRYAAKALLEKACDLLRTTDLPVSEIALKLGYSNSQNFIRYFKSEFGITPGRFRSAKS